MAFRPKLFLFCVVLVVGATVIIKPSVFWTAQGGADDQADTSTELTSSEEFRRINDEMESAYAALHRARAERRQQEASKPWFNKDPSLDEETARLVQYEQELSLQARQLEGERELWLASQRAITPLWSKRAFDEARELWWQRQKAHGESSIFLWKWDMFFGAIFGNRGRDESLGAAIVGAVLKLVWRLTAGVIIALVDWIIRLPFYLREYGVYSSNEMPEWADPQAHAAHSGARLSDGAGASDINKDGTQRIAVVMPTPDILAQDKPGWVSRRTLDMFAVYAVLLAGGLLAGFLLIAVVWSPIVALLGFLIVSAKRNPRQDAYVRHYHVE